jgi:hypothetical protein
MVILNFIPLTKLEKVSYEIFIFSIATQKNSIKPKICRFNLIFLQSDYFIA